MARGSFPLWGGVFVLFIVGFGFSLYATKLVLELNMENKALQDKLLHANADAQAAVMDKEQCTARASQSRSKNADRILELEVALEVKEQRLVKLQESEELLASLQQQLTELQREHAVLGESQQRWQNLQDEIKQIHHTEEKRSTSEVEAWKKEGECKALLSIAQREVASLKDELKKQPPSPPQVYKGKGNNNKESSENDESDEELVVALRSKVAVLEHRGKVLEDQLGAMRLANNRGIPLAKMAGAATVKDTESVYRNMQGEVEAKTKQLAEKEKEIAGLQEALSSCKEDLETVKEEVEKQFTAKIDGHMKTHANGKTKKGHPTCGAESGKCPVLITGTARSGTTHISEIFIAAGFDLPHEKLGLEGTVDWMRGPDTLAFDVVLHQVRHPLHVIASCTTLKPRSWEKIQRAIGMPRAASGKTGASANLLKCMHYWYYWNMLVAETANWVYRIEDADYLDICLRAGFGERRCHLVDWSKAVKATSKKSNARSHEDITWAKLSSLDAKLTEKVKGMAVRYGYSVEEKSSSADYALNIDAKDVDS